MAKIDVDALLKSAEEAAQAAEGILKGGKAPMAYDEEDDEDEDDKKKNGPLKKQTAAERKAGVMAPDGMKAKKAKKSFDAAKEQPEDQEDPGNPQADTDDHVADDSPFDEDDEKDNDSDEGKKRSRAHANAEMPGGRNKSLRDDTDVQKGTEVSNFLKGLVEGLDARLDDQAELSVGMIKSVAALVQSNVALSKQLGEQDKVIKAMAGRLEKIEGQPVGRRSAGAPLHKSAERFPDFPVERQSLNKSQVAAKLVAMAQRREVEISPVELSIFLQSGRLRPDLAEAVGLTAE